MPIFKGREGGKSSEELRETAEEKRTFHWLHFFHVKSFLGRPYKLVSLLLSEQQIEEKLHVFGVDRKTAARWGNFEVKKVR